MCLRTFEGQSREEAKEEEEKDVDEEEEEERESGKGASEAKERVAHWAGADLSWN